MDRILNGVERPHFHGGTITGTYKIYSDTLLMFYLRTKRPEIYGTLAETSLGGDDAQSVTRQLDVIAERVKAREAAREEARDAADQE